MNDTSGIVMVELWGGPYDGERRYATAGLNLVLICGERTDMYVPYTPGRLKWYPPRPITITSITYYET